MGLNLRHRFRLWLGERSPRYKAYDLLIKNTDSYLHTTGWFASLKTGRPIDQHGNPIPWMNYPVIDFLSKRLTADLHLFEFGSGQSTAFYAKLVASVTSVEYDQAWHDTVSKTLPANATLIYQPHDEDGDYCRAINRDNKQYDVVVIDGADRNHCMTQALPRLTPQGVVILDDTQWDEYLPGIQHAQSQGFRHLPLHGLKATGHIPYATSILYRPDNCLGI